MVVVAGNDHDLLLGTHPCGESRQHARSCGERVSDRALAQLNHVTQQHQPIGFGSGAGQYLNEGIVIERCPAVARSDVQVRNDERRHVQF